MPQVAGWVVRWGSVVREFRLHELGRAIEFEVAKTRELQAESGEAGLWPVYLEAMMGWAPPAAGKSERRGPRRQTDGRD